VTFELYTVANDPALYPSGWGVRLIHAATELLVPGCSLILCDWNEFSAVVSSLVPVDVDVTCAVN